MLKLLIVIALGALVVIAVVRAVAMLRMMPPGQRLRTLPLLLKIYTRGATRPPSWLAMEDDDLAPPEGTIPAVGWETIDEAPGLVTNAQRLTEEGGFARVCDIDSDGTALIFRESPGPNGYEGWLQARDGTRTEVARGGVHSTGEFIDGSVQNGVVSWLRDDPPTQRVEVWRWDGVHGARILHRLDYSATRGPGAINGWTLVAGDTTATTFLPGGVGTIVAHHPDHGVVHIAATPFVTLHRDLVAEARGLRKAAVVAYVPDQPRGVVAELDLDVWPPRLVPLVKGPFPGASTQMGQVLGFWDGSRMLEVPNWKGILLGSGFAGDPVGDGRWIAFVRSVQSANDRKVLNQAAVVVDTGSGTRMTLSKISSGRMHLRGRYVAWHEAAPHRAGDWDRTYAGTTSWVAELVGHAKGPGPAGPGP